MKNPQVSQIHHMCESASSVDSNSINLISVNLK